MMTGNVSMWTLNERYIKFRSNLNILWTFHACLQMFANMQTIYKHYEHYAYEHPDNVHHVCLVFAYKWNIC